MKSYNVPLYALIVLLISSVILISFMIFIVVQWQKMLNLEKAIRRAWYDTETCGGPECQLTVSDDLWGLTPTKTFNKNNARTLIDFVARLNLLEDELQVPNSPIGYDLIATYKPKVGPIFAAVWMSGNNMIIAFRATSTDEEISKDLNIEQVQWKDMMIHSGFKDVYESFAPQILALIDEKNPKYIYTSGHSLGGSISSLLTIELTPSRFVCGYVFGCPRIGNEQCDIRLKRDAPAFWRVSNRSDLISDMPPVVTPSLKRPDDQLFYYYPAGNEHSFDLNWKTLRNNHFLPLYIYYLNSLIT